MVVLPLVEDIAQRLALPNTEVIRGRAEELPRKKTYDFVLGRAVTALPVFFGWVRDKVAKGSRNSPANGILYLKGGDLKNELNGISHKSVEISHFYDEKFFNEKKIICIDKKTIISHKSK